MTFSQPINLNAYAVQSSISNIKRGFVIKNATRNEGDVSFKATSSFDGKMRTYYSKGIACFGESEDALYAHYDVKKDSRNVYFGSKNYNNTFPIFGMFEFQGENIYKINTDEGIVVYLIESGGEIPGLSYYLLGRRKDGIWVKYIDTDDIIKNYFGRTFLMCNLKKVNDNTIIFKFRSGHRVSDAKYIEGEFRFKWDEAAQWFGVEQVVY